MADRGDLIADRYHLLERLGGGAMGMVWRAHDTVLDRDVAVKELLIHGGMTATQAQQANQRARREARIAARLHHPHAIGVYDVVEHAGRPCLIMEFLPARTLADLIAERGRLPIGQVGRIGAQIAGALAMAHAAGVVHRDVKPGNVLLGADGTAKLTDFGISRAVGDSTITATGILAGTPAYFAPEVARGYEASYSSDVFSLGATLYCAVDGAPPFGLDGNPIALLYRIANNPVPPPQHAGPLTDILTNLLRTDPHERPTAREAERALTDIQSVPAPAVAPPASAAMSPSGGRRRRRAVIATLLLAMLATTAILVTLMTNDSGSNTATALPATPVPTRHPAATTTPPPPITIGRTVTPSRTPTPTAQDAHGQLTDAIIGYYQLVPDNLSSAWNHMTADYQQHHAGGMSGYQRFWQPVARVSLSDVTATTPSTVTATIDYFYRSGNVVVERTRFGLVQQGGIWKIASSTVLSHSGTAD